MAYVSASCVKCNVNILYLIDKFINLDLNVYAGLIATMGVGYGCAICGSYCLPLRQRNENISIL